MRTHEPVFMKKSCILGLALLAAANSAFSAQSLTYVDLIKRLTDLEYLATLPPPGDTMAEWTSYDRKSKYDAATGKYVGWDANGDGDGIIRKEGNQLVLAEMEGPGCIWRTWSAAPKRGHVRIYLDGAKEPVVDLPFDKYFDCSTAPFTRAALVNTVSRGANNYVPIPYQKSCKIVADPGWGQYFHFNYETFPKGTQVPTFRMKLTPEESAALDQANDILSRCDYAAAHPYEGQKVERNTVDLEPGKTKLVARLKGPQAVACIRAKFKLPPAPADRDALRELVIRIKWDGEAEPSVWSPIGDFFGSASANNYRSLPLGHGGDEWWYCNWYMPFEKSAQIELINDGKTAQTVEMEVTHAPLSQPIEKLARFHAKWHRDALLPADPERAIDWPIVKTDGVGRFVGVMLHIWNPRGSWWGEGDEKFFVDGEKFPSSIGTGSEDYFGYAWCDPGLFQNAYHNQTHNDGYNRGHVVVNRWHISDNIPFQKSFEGCIEKYYPNARPTLYATTAYWYLAAGGKDPYPQIALAERVGYWTNVLPLFRVDGALEGEKLKILSKTGGQTEVQDMTGFPGQWSSDLHLWWLEGHPGDKLELAVPVEKAGKYELRARLTKAPDYAIVRLRLDGQDVGAPVDLYAPEVSATRVLKLGEHDLTAGTHTFGVEIVGANEKAAKAYMFGLDYIKLDPPK